ncbi:beta strand repeat-containing protein [Spirosoma sp. KNUC1025]|uniref:beta strand repeat-containing protein n=1 Tax=Spirosoma sp. KNUC1025 TaxID=2894082 RepID=UPI003866CD60|nr:hypothetical protein LN737_15640 [Spirosoma sp. KNUC1025]
MPIDLADDVVSANDGALTAMPSATANRGMDYGIITSAKLSGNNLTITGFIGNDQSTNVTTFGTGAIVQFYIADNSPADQDGHIIVSDGFSVAHAEGKTYLGSLTADAGGKFSGTLDVTGKGVVLGTTMITNTATETGGSTSEFGAIYKPVNTLTVSNNQFSCQTFATYPNNTINSEYSAITNANLNGNLFSVSFAQEAQLYNWTANTAGAGATVYNYGAGSNNPNFLIANSGWPNSVIAVDMGYYLGGGTITDYANNWTTTTFTSVLPANSMMHLIDVETTETLLFEFLDASGNPLPISGNVQAYLGSDQTTSAIYSEPTSTQILLNGANLIATNDPVWSFQFLNANVKSVRFYQYAQSNLQSPDHTYDFTFSVESKTAPTVGAITHPNCTTTTGSVVLSGLPASGTWTLTRSPGAVTTTGTGTSAVISGLAPGTYTFTVTNSTGCTSLSTTAVTINAAICGSVWNDVDGNLSQNGSETGTNAGGPLYVNLVDGTGTVIASTTVSATGSYSLSGPASTTGLKLVLTNTASSTSPGSLPTGWVNTGESVGVTNTATQSATLGVIELTIGASSITAQNFGIEHVPTAGSGSQSGGTNPGGTTQVAVSGSAFTNTTSSSDPSPGAVTSIRLTSFPTGAASVVINGITYTSSTWPAGGLVVTTDATGSPTQTITADPSFNGSGNVVFSFVAIDAAGKESTNTGTATIFFTPATCTIYSTTTGTSAMSYTWSGGTGAFSQNNSNTRSISCSGGVSAGFIVHWNVTETASYSVSCPSCAVMTFEEATSPTGPWTVTSTVSYAQLLGGGYGYDQTIVGTGVTYVRFHFVYAGSGPYTGDFHVNIGASYSCTPVVPAITAATTTNSCPAATVNLTTLANIGSLPSGSTLVWSTHNPITGSNDTLTTAQASAVSSGTYYAYYRKVATGCFSNADSVAVTTAACINISGQVWDDADGSLSQNGSETTTNAGGPLYVNLVDGSNTVVASVSVAADGSYSLSGVPTNVTGYKLVLASTATATSPGTLPTGWVNTGESVDPSNTASQGSTLGVIELTTGTGAITNQNFGIEKLPNPGSGSNTVTNAGGTSPVSVPASTFTNTTPSGDTAPGSVTAIHVTSFPTNVTSLTINGVTYTSATFPVSGVNVPTDGSGSPTVPILVDPTDDSNLVVITFTAVDNAGKESTTTGTATLNSTPTTTTVSGSVWDDADGSVTLNGSETTTNAGGPLFVNLVNSSGVVVASAAVSPTGSYTLTGVPTGASGLSLVLTNTASSTTAGGLPTGWVNTGESVDASNTATQSATLGVIELTTSTGAVTNQNFGIEKLPVPGSGTATVANGGGTTPVTLPPGAFTTVSPSSDTAPGSVTAIHITSFPSNVTSLTINGTVYTAGSFPVGGVVVPTDGSGSPTVPILVDPTNDSNPVVITFTAVDNAGKESLTTGTATLNSTLTTTISGKVWDDADGSLSQNGSETTTNAGGPLYVNLVDGSNTVVASVSVASDGSYSLSGVPTNVTGYKLVLASTATATSPGTLPTGWVNTGELVDPSNTATQGSTLGVIELSTGTGAVSNQNFGIEKLPTPGSGTATVANGGGTLPVTVPPVAFTTVSPSSDTAPGSVTAIHVTSFPTNVTSLTINGVTYTSATFPVSGVNVPTDGSGSPTVPILVDPTDDSNLVVITFTAVDNAGKESTTTGTATLNSTPTTTTVSGSVWDDADGSVTLNGSETTTNAGGPLFVNLVNSSGVVVASAAVSPTGSYTLTGVPTGASGLSLVLTNTASSTTAGGLPTGWVNTGESVDASNTATQSATLGVIELTTSTGAVTNQNFGIEKLPTPGSGSNTVTNAGGTSPVSVPASTFTNTTPSGDTAPGSVTAIRISSFPSNVTSLTINGNVYTASSPEFSGGSPTGVVVPTDGSGNPTVAILVDPTNDSNPVVISFTAVDNAGKESTTTGTATINSTAVPDLTPIIYARPSTTYNTTTISVVVDVFELKNVATSGLITVKVNKDPKISLSFTGSATSVGGRPVSNSVWSFDGVSDDYYYLLTSTQVVGGGSVLSFGLSGTLTPGATSGTLTLTSVIEGGSGGEVKLTNNTDADKIDFFQQ